MTTVKINLRNNALTQYGAFPFTDFCMFNGRPLGAGPDGIFTLDGDGLKDIYTISSGIYTTPTDEREILAWFELPTSQLGINNIKQGRRLYVGGEFNGPMTVKVEATGELAVTITYNITPRNTDNLQHTIQVPLNSRQKSEYLGFTFTNVSGSDFSIDFIDMVLINVARRLDL